MSESDLEQRTYRECRVEPDESETRIVGYAIVFHSLSVDFGMFREQIAPSAVDRTLKEATDVRALVDHDSGKIIGRTRAGTLALKKDRHGLKVTIEPDPEISYARDILRAVKRGDVSGMSFAFRALEDEWNYEEDPPLRTVTDMKISEVSVVGFPAYEATDVQVAMRSLDAFRKEQGGSRVAWLQKWHKTKTA